METYDSSIETLKHIKQIAIYINYLQNQLYEYEKINKSINSNVDDATLIDLMRLLLSGYDIPDYDNLFHDINNNSKEYKLGYKYNDKVELLNVYNNIFDDIKVNHDRSKLMEPEKHEFDIWTPRLQEAKLGTTMYDYFLQQLNGALQHHYLVNEHHPEHYPNGIHGMNIIRISEMLSDWTATADRHEDGNIYDSIEILSNRFKYGKDMIKVLSNTCEKCFNKSK